MSLTSESGSPVAPLLSRAARLHLVGPSGSGKSWLARHIAAARGWPVHHLDDLAHEAGGGSPLRARTELDALIRSIQAEPAWICEGVDLAWTEPLLESADVILWLDEEQWSVRARNILRRFATGAAGEARSQRGWRRVGRFSDYVRRLRELGSALIESRRYATSRDSTASAETRAAFRTALARHADNVVRCTDAKGRAEATRLLTNLRGRPSVVERDGAMG